MSHPSIYCKLLEKGKITPNFYCSDEFRIRAKIREVTHKDGYVFWAWEDTDASLIHPPINDETFKFTMLDLDWNKNIWSDFQDYKPIWGIPKFLDYEFIFDPQAFQNMEGGQWQVFRKNCRKWPRKFSSDVNVLQYKWVSQYVKEWGANRLWEELSELFIKWVRNKPDNEEIQGDEIMLSYLQSGENRKVLYNNKRGDIYGVNIWDFNYKFINFRFTFNPPEDFLSEYMRILFYTDPDILSKNKLVNDGGCLGSESLRKFKLKMNPIWARKVMSWEKE